VTAHAKILVAALLVAFALPTASVGAPRMLVGLYDENQSFYTNPARTFPLMRTLRTQIVRVNLYWGGRFGAVRPKVVAPRFDDPAGYGTSKQPSVGVSGLSGEFRVPAQPARYQYALLQASDHDGIAALKAANKGIKVIAYKSAAATFSFATTPEGADQEFLPSGVGYAKTAEQHPEWFLADKDEKRIESCISQGRWLMDVGNPEYQTAWFENVSAELKEKGFDGVLLDDVETSVGRHLCGRTIPKYPGDDGYAAAMESFLAKVAPELKAKGLLALPKISLPRNAAAVATWTKWISYGSGAALDSWTKSGSEPSEHLAGDDWAHQQALLKETERAGKIFLGLTSGPATDLRSIRYSRASFLLGWNAGSSAVVYTSPTAESWSPETAVEVGPPLGAAREAGGVWQREFRDGLVLVNPSTTAKTVKLDNSYFTPSRQLITSIRLEPASGITLRFPNFVGGTDTGAAKRRPRDATNPADPAYDWSLYDRTVRFAAANRIRIVFSIFGTPKWANNGLGLRYAPSTPADLLKFAYAAAKRYSGTYRAEDGRLLPAVRHWLAWNEPNNPVFLLPVYKRVAGKWVLQSPRDYAAICNAITRGIHLTLIRGEKVGCGVTAPRGGSGPKSKRPSVAPLPFLREAKKAGMRGFDAYAHHPYYDRPSETPAWRPKNKRHVVLGNIDVLLRELDRLYGRKTRLWITEYGYQTWKPDKKFGVTWANQAKYLTEAYARARKTRRIDMMLWFLLRDDRNIKAGWQSGFFTTGGKRKPSAEAFKRLPR